MVFRPGPCQWPFLRWLPLIFSFFLHTLAESPASARRTEEGCSSRTDRCRRAPCGCQSRSPGWGWLQALQQRPPASAAGSQSSGQVCTVQTPPPGAWGTGERPTPLAELAQDTLRGVSEGLRVPWTLGGWEGAMGSGTCRKAKLIKPLLRRLEEGTAQEPIPGDSVRQQRCLALLKLEVARDSGAGRLPLTHGQSKAVIGLPQKTLGPSLILCQMLTEGRVHAKLPAGHQGVQGGQE